MMKRLFILGSHLAILGLLMGWLGSTTAFAQSERASANGTWKWSYARQDSQARETTLKLQQEGEKLTGAITGRSGTETPIADGAIKGDEISFTVTREFNGQKFTMKYQGKLAGDSITGTTAYERDGESRSREWKAARAIDPTGLWKWTFTRPDSSRPGRESMLKLALADGKLSGTLTSGGRENTPPISTAITDAKLAEGTLSFTVSREFGGQTRTVKYAGKLEGDKITGKVEMVFNDQNRSVDWIAKRVAAKSRPVLQDMEREPDVIFVPTPQKAVDKMLELAQVKKGDVIYDLGCGDGRIVVTAAKQFGLEAHGFDIDPQRIQESLDNIEKSGVGDLVTIEQKDIFTLDLSKANVVTLYLLPSLNVKLIPQLEKLKPGSRIVSHDFDMEGVTPDKVVEVTDDDQETHTIYLWTAPLKKTGGTQAAN